MKTRKQINNELFEYFWNRLPADDCGEARDWVVEYFKELVGEHNARILNEYQLSKEKGSDESVLFAPIEKATDFLLKEELVYECKTSPLCSHNTNGRDPNKPCSVSAPTK